MLHSLPNLRRPGTFLVALILGSLAFTACTDLDDDAPTAPEVREQGPGPSLAEAARTQDFGPALAASRQHTPALMSVPGVVGVGVGLNDDGRPAVKIFLAHGQVEGLPQSLGDVPVATEVTGLFRARADRTSRTRPAPIGFSIGHPDVTAGTLGARVKDGSGKIFILSNNHVIANSNDANIDDPTLQPGAVDGGSDPDDVIGTLFDYQPIDFDGGTNEMDAAISIVDGTDVSGATPSDEGYGAPGTTVTLAGVGLELQKYGRTTGHTQGEVSEIDVTVTVCYAGFIFCTKAATFENQIAITPGGFSDGGDSGSLIVTNDSDRNPVGLLFAGSSDRTIANPIGPVLDRFNVQIDPTVPGDDGGGDTNSAPTASFTSSCTDLACDFDGSGSSDSDGSIASWAWDFGDGATDTGETVSHTYGADGTYTVTLTVTDDDGATDSQQQDVTVSSGDDGGDGGDTAPSIDTFQVGTRTTGPWQRADVTWEVSDTDGDLASVTLKLLAGDGSVLDSQSTSVSGGSASGQTELRTRSGTPTHVRITVTDATDLSVTDEKAIQF